MPDDERRRRRLGDETKGRIADLASGWTVDPEPPAPEPEPAPAPRKKQKTLPPPPPGSAARRALEGAIVDAAETPAPEPAAAKSQTIPPPLPPPRKPTGPLPVVTAPSNDSSVPSLAAGPAKSGGVLSRDPDDSSIPSLGGPRRAQRPSQVKSGPSETGTVDVSGLIAEKTQPPERIIPPPTVDASALVPTQALVDKSGVVQAKALGDKSGALPSRTLGDRSGPVPAKAGAQGTPTRPPPTMPPPTRAAGTTGPLSAPSSGKVGSGSGSAPAPSSGKVGTASGSAPAITSRLPLPPDRSDVAPAPPLPPPPAMRAPRAALVVDEPVLETIPDDGPLGMKLAVPLGEFDSHTVSEEVKLRNAYEQSTAVRDPANALLGMAEPPRGDPSASDLATHRFERADPTRSGADATEIHVPTDRRTPAGKLRTQAMLRRKRGIGGDMRYVLTVMLGLRRARRELAALEAKQVTRLAGRRRHLVTLGRVAAIADNFTHPALGKARESLAGVEDERSRHTGSVAAADAELTRVRRDREAKAKQHVVDLAALDAELADIAKKLAPLEKQTASAARRAADLRESLQRIDNKIAATEQSMTAVKTQEHDRAAIRAEIVALKADRKSIERDEPEIAGELDTLNPKIAELEAKRVAARAKRVELDQAEVEDQRRAEELLAAIGAKRKVVDRAAGDAETLRDKILFELGERLYVDRPADFTYELGPIDAIDVEIGTGDRRVMELKEILASVDRWKLARGIAMLILIAGAIGTAVWWALYYAD